MLFRIPVTDVRFGDASRRRPIAGCAAFCLAGSRAVAETTVFLDRASFLSELSNPIIYTFEPGDGFPVAPSEISSFGDGAVWSTSIDGPASIGIYAPSVWNQVLTGRAIISAGVPQVDFLVPVTLSFTQPVYAIGFDAVATATAGAAVPVLRVTYAAGVPQDEFVRQPPGTSDGIAFLGVISTDPIVGIQFYAAPADQPDTTGVCAGAMDNLTIGTAVPEPGALGALAGVLLLFRHRRSRSITLYAAKRS